MKTYYALQHADTKNFLALQPKWDSSKIYGWIAEVENADHFNYIGHLLRSVAALAKNSPGINWNDLNIVKVIEKTDFNIEQL